MWSRRFYRFMVKVSSCPCIPDQRCICDTCKLWRQNVPLLPLTFEIIPISYMKMNNFLDDWNFHLINKTLCFQPLRVREIRKLFSSKNLQSAGDGWWSWILEGDHRQKGQTLVRSHVAGDICSIWNSHFRRRHPLWPCHWKWLWLHQGCFDCTKETTKGCWMNWGEDSDNDWRIKIVSNTDIVEIWFYTDGGLTGVREAKA